MIGTIFYPAVALIYGVGNWFTFLALIIHVQTQSGAAASAALFLVQTLPALLVAGQIARRIPLEKTRVAWIGCQLVVVALTVPAAFLSTSCGLSMCMRR